jgi:DNA-binding MarR family transcriptional regulator
MYLHTLMAFPEQSKKTLWTDAASLIEVCAGANSRLAARRITQFFDRELAPIGLSLSQLGLMAQIAAASDDTLGALARRMSLEQSSLSRNLRTLETEGLVEIANVDGDLRRRAVWLTDAGAKRLEAAVPVWRNVQAELQKLGALELARALARATEALAAD